MAKRERQPADDGEWPEGWLDFVAWCDDPDADPDAYVFIDGSWFRRERVSIDARRKRKRELPKQTPGDKLLTLAEASALIRTPSETIRFWIWQGRLTAYRPGRAVLVRESDLLALVEANETTKRRARKARGK